MNKETRGDTRPQPKPEADGFFSLKLRPWRTLAFFMMLACLATLAGFLGGLWWPFENCACFRVQCALVLAVGGLIFWCGKRRNAAIVLVSFALVNAVAFVPLYFGAEKTTTPPQFRLMCLNVHTANREYELVCAAVRAAKPDAVAFLEVNEAWMAHLETLRAEFPYCKYEQREDNFGLAFFSRAAPDEIALRHFGSAEVPTAVARYTVAGTPLALIATHPVPPVNAQYVRWRNEQMARLAGFARAIPGARIVCGDLNMTSDSPVFAQFLSETGLRDSRQGFGLQPTWPVNMPPLWIAIDHCLVSRQIIVHDRRVGPNVGSDHYPIVVDFSLRE